MRQLNKTIIKTIKHWIAMRNWMKKYNGEFLHIEGNKYKKLWLSEMAETLGDYPYEQKCALCNKNISCLFCALRRIGHNCNDENSLWMKIVYAENKEDWLLCSWKLLKVLWSLRYWVD